MNRLSLFALAALLSVAACQPQDEAPPADDGVVATPADAPAPAVEPLPETVDTTVAAPTIDPAVEAPVTEPAEQQQH
ncbi:MAG TPA: hypothetical protein VHG51_09960 [Longimicrobiaceae bacterium]|nr:hypothetical protein [Longimicrobiaceae bacterium]